MKYTEECTLREKTKLSSWIRQRRKPNKKLIFFPLVVFGCEL